MEPLISIIVPVYNSRQYLDECIRGVLNQSYPEWELLLLDDGSTDDSCELCKKHSQYDSRIIVLSKENSGVSSTRNLGIEMSKGKYIMFLDSDDYWQDQHFLKTFVELAENNDLDIVRGEWEEVDRNGNFSGRSDFLTKRKNYEGKVLNSATFYSEIINKEYFSVLCLYKKSALGDVRFNTDKVFLEDAEFYLDLCLKKMACMYTPVFFYAYRKHSNSVSVKYVPNKFRDALGFTLVCFDKSCETTDKLLSLKYKIEGIKNYFFDLQVIGESESSYTEIQNLYISHDIPRIREQVKKTVIMEGLYNYIGALLPLNAIVYYFRIVLKFKLFVIRILRKLKLYGKTNCSNVTAAS